MNDRAEDLAEGRWTDILARAGVPDTAFTGKHGPCPLCGGKDRFRWNKAKELWVCNDCSESKYANGFALLMKLLGCDFRGAADFVREHFGGTAQPVVPRKPREQRRADDQHQYALNLERMRSIWAASRELCDSDPVMAYLRNRVPGMNFIPEFVRYHPELPYWAPPEQEGGKPQLLGKFPAMVSKAFDPQGRFVQLHKTYLTANGHKADVPVVKKTERGVGVNGFAVPLQRLVGDTLGFAEGIESAIAGSMLRGIPVWSCLNGPSMAAFDLPASLLDQVRVVVVFADNDERRPVRQAGGGHARRSAGLHFAEQLASTCRARGKRVLIVKAAKVGTDMADHWQGRAVVQEASECALAT